MIRYKEYVFYRHIGIRAFQLITKPDTSRVCSATDVHVYNTIMDFLGSTWTSSLPIDDIHPQYADDTFVLIQ